MFFLIISNIFSNTLALTDEAAGKSAESAGLSDYLQQAASDGVKRVWDDVLNFTKPTQDSKPAQDSNPMHDSNPTQDSNPKPGHPNPQNNPDEQPGHPNPQNGPCKQHEHPNPNPQNGPCKQPKQPNSKSNRCHPDCRTLCDIIRDDEQSRACKCN